MVQRFSDLVRARVRAGASLDGAVRAVHGAPVPAGYMSEIRQWVIEYPTVEDALAACGLDE
jgi:hypothetical protein